MAMSCGEKPANTLLHEPAQTRRLLCTVPPLGQGCAQSRSQLAAPFEHGLGEAKKRELKPGDVFRPWNSPADPTCQLKLHFSGS